MKTTATKTVKKARKPNPAFMKPLMPSMDLGKIVGTNPLPRTQAVKKVWDYIKSNGLQDKINRRMINADNILKNVVGKAKVSMFELTKQISKHLS